MFSFFKKSSKYKIRLIDPRHKAGTLRAWACAVGLPYTVYYRDPVDALPSPEPGWAKFYSEIFARDWNIGSREALVDQMISMGKQGHRAQLGVIVRQYCLLPPAQVMERRAVLMKAKAEGDGDAGEEAFRLDAVVTDWEGIRSARFLAWDASRAVMLAYGGCRLGWLTHAQASHYIESVARDVHRTYASWQEFGADYLRSRRFWSGSNKESELYDIVTFIQGEADSPWVRLPWNIPEFSHPASNATPDAGAPFWTPTEAGPHNE